MDSNTQEAAKENESFLKLQQAFLLKSALDESCILHQSLTLIADKWTLLILMALMQQARRNSELLKQINGISPKMLNQTLKTLMSYEMVERKVYAEMPPHVEYSLTEFGKSTAAPLLALLDWSIRWETEITRLYKQKS
ncbi:winged helix-turn-helix transcriptional regulator [Pedobacter cryoconitis]|uniref:winged helix-turn-helix transcriptional regulator n=1 Tax=Pedobacter cryoconitis TaxID=188932 RepID=UPI001617D5A0|nr:helix-turn-helix domain-containing protein [Pedobacter cryoconitis]MBB5647644.1 DNA-binding HxlR family transcriptional regulator [Pedobacter cryoconitis]